MSMLTELRQMQDQMVAELTQVPLYRALKALDRFINEVETIYQQPSEPESAEETSEKLTRAIEARIKAQDAAAQASTPKVSAYVPAQRVA